MEGFASLFDEAMAFLVGAPDSKERESLQDEYNKAFLLEEDEDKARIMKARYILKVCGWMFATVVSAVMLIAAIASLS